MDEIPYFQELSFIGNEAEVAPRIRVLRVLARIIARDFLNNTSDGKNNDSTTKNDRRNGLTHDESIP
jgi:hypothetical protein